MDDQEVVDNALRILASRMKVRDVYNNATDLKRFLTLKLAEQEREVFAIVVLDARHQLIEYTELFYGTIDKTQVYPREIARRALKLNAAAVVLAHNHRSGIAEPSRSDIALTEGVIEILKKLEIRTLDHIVIGGNTAVSFAERGLI